MKRRILSFFLSFVMVVSMLPLQVLAAAPVNTATVIVQDNGGNAITNANVIVTQENGTSCTVTEVTGQGKYQFPKGAVGQDDLYNIIVDKIGYERQTVTMHGTSGSILITLSAVTGEQWQTFQIFSGSRELLEIDVDLKALNALKESHPDVVKYVENTDDGNRWEFIPGEDQESAFWAAVLNCVDAESREALVAVGLGAGSGFMITGLAEQLNGTYVALASTAGLIELYDKEGRFVGAIPDDNNENEEEIHNRVHLGYVQYLNMTWDANKHVYIDNGEVYKITIAKKGSNPGYYEIESRVKQTDMCVVTYTDGVDGENIFSEQKYAVDLNDAVPGYVEEASDLDQDGEPEREGYSFVGWATPEGGECPDQVNGSIILHAVWHIAPQYTGTVKVYVGGSFNATTEEITKGTPTAIEDILGSGVGLYLAEENNDDYLKLTAVKNETGVYSAALGNGRYYVYYSYDEETYTKLSDQILWMENADRTCYLFYNYTITYDYAGGTIEDEAGPFTEQVLAGSKVVINNTAPVREGYTFAGWKDTASDTAYQPGDVLTTNLGKSYELTAQWVSDDVEHKFNFTINADFFVTLDIAAVDVEVVRVTDQGSVAVSEPIRVELLSNDDGNTPVSVTVSPGYHYTVRPIKYYLWDNTEMSVDNEVAYYTNVTVTDTDALGAYVGGQSQQGTVTVAIKRGPIPTSMLALRAMGGTFTNGANIVLEVSRLPDLSLPEYTPTAPQGKKFAGWKWTQGTKVKTGEVLVTNSVLDAIWEDVSTDTPDSPPTEEEPSVPGAKITVKGQVTVDNGYPQENGDGTIGHQAINPNDRVTSITVLLQRAVGTIGYYETIDVQTLSWDEKTGNVTAKEGTRVCGCVKGCLKTLGVSIVEYSFQNVPADGRYRVVALSPNYTAFYQCEVGSINDPVDYLSYNVNDYRAGDENGDRIAVVNALIKFTPPSFDVKYEVDASKIGTLCRPNEVEILVTYDKVFRNITDPSEWPVISQMVYDGNVLRGDDVALNSGIGSGSYPVWTSSSSGKEVYDYAIRVNSVDGEQYLEEDPRFAIEYIAPAHLDTLAGTNTQNKLLKAILVPRAYSVTYELDGGSLAGQEHPHDYVWSHAEKLERFNAVPTRNGYVFEGWDVKIGSGARQPLEDVIIRGDVSGDIVFYAKWSRVVVNLQVVMDHSGATDYTGTLKTQLTSRPAGEEDENFRPVEGSSKNYGHGIWHTNNAVDVVEIPYIYSYSELSADEHYNVNVAMSSYLVVDSYTFTEGNSATTGVVITPDQEDGDNTTEPDQEDGDNTTEVEHNVVVCLRYDSELLHLEFSVEVPEEEARWPESVGVKVTCWDPDKDVWTVIGQHEETLMEIPIKTNNGTTNGVGTGVCDVGRWLDGTTPNYYRIEVVSLTLRNGTVVDLTEKTDEVLYNAVGYTATVSVTGGAAAEVGELAGVFGTSEKNAQTGTLKAVVDMGKVVFYATNSDWLKPVDEPGGEADGEVAPEEDVFRIYYPAAEEGSSYGEHYMKADGSIDAFYDIPEFEYATHNKYIFKGWYDSEEIVPDDEDTGSDTTDEDALVALKWNDKYLTESAEDVHFYDHWIRTGIVDKEPEDTKDTGETTYVGFDLFGVQIRDAENDNIPHHGEAGYGLRFLASMSEKVHEELDSLQVASEDATEDKFEYGFVLAPSVLVERAAAENSDYEILFKDKNVNGVDTRSTHSYVSNQRSNGKNSAGEEVIDHFNGRNYRIFTVVVTYKNLNETALTTALKTDFTARAYIRYNDANGLLRTYHNNYTGTIYYSGVSISYADVANVISKKMAGEV